MPGGCFRRPLSNGRLVIAALRVGAQLDLAFSPVFVNVAGLTEICVAAGRFYRRLFAVGAEFVSGLRGLLLHTKYKDAPPGTFADPLLREAAPPLNARASALGACELRADHGTGPAPRPVSL